jgi:triacylglycerol lipase
MRQHVFLIPGFFGFANVGDLKYFRHVRSFLHAALGARGVAPAIHYVATRPLASLERRAAILADAMAEHAGGDDAPIHLVGHSTGGLDARLVTAPDAEIPSPVDLEPLADRVRTVVTVATPHAGTPLADTFQGPLGEPLLKLLSVASLHVVRVGGMPLPTLMALTRLLAPPLRWDRIAGEMVDQIYREILRDFDPARRDELKRFLEQAAEDTSLVSQLTPRAMIRFNVRTEDRDGVRHGCVVARAQRPSLTAPLRLGLRAEDQATYTLFRVLHALVSRFPTRHVPALDDGQRRTLSDAYGGLPSRHCNDAIVPTLSQVRGPVIHACWADHHDVIGHFPERDADPPHVDWVRSLSGFDREAFRRLWGDVASFLVRN